MTKDPRLKTLILSIVFSAFGPIVTLIALFMNTSATQFADFVRRTAELSVLIFALYVYLKLSNNTHTKAQKNRFKITVYRLSGSILLFSAAILSFLFIQALITPKVPEGNVILGLSIASLGIFFNGYFFIRYRRFNNQDHHFVMDSQGKIYQAKTMVDVSVVIALSSILIFPNSEISYWIDTLGTFVIALYLISRGFNLIFKAYKKNP